MARWTDLADWQGETVNEGGSMGPIRMLVIHVEHGSIAWCKNPAAKVSAHFFNPKSGRLVQLVDTARVAWAEVDFNNVAISCEHEGNSGDSLTPSQIENTAQLLARIHQVHGVPLAVLNDPAGSGVIGHGLLGMAGGGHFDCPGSPILAQRAAIIARAAQILGGSTPIPTPTTTEDDMPVFATGEIPQDTGAHMVLVPPPNLANGQWGDVHFSLGCDFVDGLTVRCAAWVDGVGWDIKTVAVPSAGDRVNPWGGPLPKGTQKISVVRSTAAGAVGWLVEAAHR
jgi:hypothetical protein